MNLKILLSDIDECDVAYNESYINILDSMISMYDKSISMLDNDTSGNMPHIIQESKTNEDETVVEKIIYAIPRLIAAFIRKIKSLFSPTKKKKTHIKHSEDYSVELLSKRYELAKSVVDNNPDLILKVGGGIAAGAAAVGIWAKDKANKAKEALDLKRDIAGNIAQHKAKFAEAKSYADKCEDEMIAITIYPTKLKIYALSDIGYIKKAIDQYISSVKAAVSRMTNKAKNAKSRSEFDKAFGQIIDTDIERPLYLIESVTPSFNTKEYESLNEFQTIVERTWTQTMDDVKKEIDTLVDMIREAYNYFDNRKLINITSEEARNKKHQKEAEEMCIKISKIVIDNIQYILDKVAVYNKNAESMIDDIESKSGNKKDYITKHDSHTKDIFNNDNTKNVGTYLNKQENYNPEIYVKLLNAICNTIVDNGYKVNKTSDSQAFLKRDTGICAPVKSDNIHVSINPNTRFIDVVRNVNYDDDKTMKDTYSLSSSVGNSHATKRDMHNKTDETDALKLLSSETLFDNIDKAVKNVVGR